ncbi:MULTISPECIES: hypothetical protein [Paracoccus]|uniref:hypothetical protein n=1 Tax=Paracoccus TaxID=265 RepID=UPI00041E509C|nr:MULTISPECIES: hypothetical protein [Paracoccus]
MSSLKPILILAATLGLAACGDTVTERAATGGVSGAAVAGPAGAVVGGTVGAVSTVN